MCIITVPLLLHFISARQPRSNYYTACDCSEAQMRFKYGRNSLHWPPPEGVVDELMTILTVKHTNPCPQHNEYSWAIILMPTSIPPVKWSALRWVCSQTYLFQVHIHNLIPNIVILYVQFKFQNLTKHFIKRMKYKLEFVKFQLLFSRKYFGKI